MSRKLMRNRVRCLACNKILESKHRHDWVTCGCSNETFVDGGLDYQRIGAINLSKVAIIDDDDTEHEMTEVMREEQ